MVAAFSPEGRVRSVSSVKSGPTMGGKVVPSALARAAAAAAAAYSETRSYWF